MTNLVTAIFSDVQTARRAAEDLAANGFPTEAVSVVATEQHREAIRAHPGLSNITDYNAGRGAVAGSIFGAVAGGIVALVLLAVPGGIIGAGPLVAALGGAAAGAAGGSLVGALIGTGIPEKEAKAYERHIREGGILVAVQAPDLRRATLAERVLNQAGPITPPHTASTATA